jgi:hypothetical protein
LSRVESTQMNIKQKNKKQIAWYWGLPLSPSLSSYVSFKGNVRVSYGSGKNAKSNRETA